MNKHYKLNLSYPIISTPTPSMSCSPGLLTARVSIGLVLDQTRRLQPQKTGDVWDTEDGRCHKCRIWVGYPFWLIFTKHSKIFKKINIFFRTKKSKNNKNELQRKFEVPSKEKRFSKEPNSTNSKEG